MLDADDDCRDDMTTLLSKAGSNLTVKQLLDTLQEVLDFEASIVKKYATPVDPNFLPIQECVSDLILAGRYPKSNSAGDRGAAKQANLRSLRAPYERLHLRPRQVRIYF